MVKQSTAPRAMRASRKLSAPDAPATLPTNEMHSKHSWPCTPGRSSLQTPSSLLASILMLPTANVLRGGVMKLRQYSTPPDALTACVAPSSPLYYTARNVGKHTSCVVTQDQVITHCQQLRKPRLETKFHDLLNRRPVRHAQSRPKQFRGQPHRIGIVRVQHLRFFAMSAAGILASPPTHSVRTGFHEHVRDLRPNHGCHEVSFHVGIVFDSASFRYQFRAL